MHQVVHRLADEEAGGEIGAEEVVAVGGRAVGRGDAVRGVGHVEPGERPAGRDRPGCRARASAAGSGRASRGLRRISASERTYSQAKLGLLLPNQWPQSSRCRPNCVWPLSVSNRPSSGRKRKSRPLIVTVFPGLERADRAAAVAVGAVDPAVEAQVEPVEPVLLVPLDEPREEDLAMVGLAVAVAVLGIEDLGCAGDEEPVPPGEQAGREAEAVEEGGGLVVAAVAVGVFERCGRRRPASPCRRCRAG